MHACMIRAGEADVEEIQIPTKSDDRPQLCLLSRILRFSSLASLLDAIGQTTIMFGLSNLALLSAVAGLSFIYFIVRLITVRRFYRDLPKPPGHSLLLGHLKMFGEIVALFPPDTHPQYFYTELHNRYPSLPAIYYLDLWPFGPAQMIITTADAAAQISVVRPYPVHGFVNWWLGIMLGPDVIAGVNGALWKKLHHMVGPMFTPAAVKTQVGVIVEHALVFRERLLRKTDEEGVHKKVDILELASQVLFDITAAIVLGFPLGAQREDGQGLELLGDFQTCFALAQPYYEAWNPLAKVKIWWRLRRARIRSGVYVESEMKRRYQALKAGEKMERKKARSIMDRMLVQRIEEEGDRARPEMDKAFARLLTSK